MNKNNHNERSFNRLVVLVTVIFIGCIIIKQYTVDMDNFKWTQDSTQNDWIVSLPDEMGFEKEILIDLHRHVIMRKDKRVQSLLIARNNQLVFEQYYSVRSVRDGTPMPVYFPPSPDTFHQMRSVTKTVTSTLIGNLLYKNTIPSVNVPLFDYFTNEDMQEADKRRNIKIKHALNFNSGLDWNEWGARNSDAMNMWLSSDPYAYILSKGVAYKPGDKFVYQGAMSVLLGGVVEIVTDMSLREYAEQALFNPLGISNYDWFAHEVTGDYLGSSGLYLRSRDLAKLGQLYLNNGMWNGQQIFSEQWAKESLKPKGKFWPDKTIEYGYNWWFPLIKNDGQRIHIGGMRGYGGQEMFIIPELQLVFVITSGAYIGQDENYPFELITNYVLPSLGLNNTVYKPKV
ncbi:beta-lactamase family protein [Photobacterium sagamiensis]|uniref:serine hydrolase domain-containing protein n=1 Tax=Photobacterium sagamiensis TaxID=2910241 RepID=UPI003D0CC7C5